MHTILISPMKTALGALFTVLFLALCGPSVLGDKSKPKASSAEGKKKIVFLAGKKSHGYAAHEHRAGCLLLAKQLNEHMGDTIEASVHFEKDWPGNAEILKNADAVIFYCNGGSGQHMAYQHLDGLDAKLKDGAGIACLHYAVEPGDDEKGRKLFLNWLGGYFETHYSVNPHWTADFKKLPEHPITRGVKPFKIYDEWYFHMRFAENMQGVTPILSALPPSKTMDRGDGRHSGNPHVRSSMERGEIQHVAWAYERPNGGRGFGFTGGHFHRNWGHDDFRTLVLNAITWCAKAEVPDNGVPSEKPTETELEKNQDYPKPVK